MGITNCYYCDIYLRALQQENLFHFPRDLHLPNIAEAVSLHKLQKKY